MGFNGKGEVKTQIESEQSKGSLTLWRVRGEGQVRTQKDCNQMEATHSLESIEGWRKKSG